MKKPVAKPNAKPKRSAAKTSAKVLKPKKGPSDHALVVDEGLLDVLVEQATRVRGRAYAPYSHYAVGAAIVTRSGRVFAGCNVENASYGGTVCAERNAIFQMVASGERDPIACAIVTEGTRGGSPCGICRQVLSEFARDMAVVLVGVSPSGAHRRDTTLARLLPDAFEFERHPPPVASRRAK